MLRYVGKFLSLMALVAVMVSPTVKAIDAEQNGQELFDRIKIDRYLDVEVWTNHSDNEFYEGDNVVISFRASRDAFVAIYSIDSRGRVNMLFPTAFDQDNFVQGGATYTIPGGDDDFDLVIDGPSGVENIQAIASRERFPIPEWYPNSGLICDWDDRLEYMDYLNGQYFVRYNGQRFAFDRAALYVNEWEQEYYRPIYYPHYPSWTVCGNVYIDYPWGATVYVNGVYWGVTPLYIPRIYVGWHTFTIYDYYGYCWEYPVHITRYNTVILDRHIVTTSPTVISKYKDVRLVGYRDPVTSGYPNYKTKVVATKPSLKNVTIDKSKTTTTTKTTTGLSKKYVRGTSKVVKTDRGFETVGSTYKGSKSKSIGKSTSGKSSASSSRVSKQSKSKSSSKASTASRYKSSSRSSSSGKSSSSSKVGKSSSSGKSSGYYQKKSGSSSYKKSSSSSKSSGSATKSSKKSSVSKRSSSSKSSGASKSSAGSGSSKSSKSSGESSSTKSAPKSKPTKGKAKTK